MIDFLYYGEANVDQDSLDAFLGLAQELKLQGLTGSSSEVNPGDSKINRNAPEEKIEEGNYFLETTPNTPKQLNVYDSHAKTEPTSHTLVSVVEAEQLKEQIKSMMT